MCPVNFHSQPPCATSLRHCRDAPLAQTPEGAASTDLEQDAAASRPSPPPAPPIDTPLPTADRSAIYEGTWCGWRRIIGAPHCFLHLQGQHACAACCGCRASLMQLPAGPCLSPPPYRHPPALSRAAHRGAGAAAGGARTLPPARHLLPADLHSAWDLPAGQGLFGGLLWRVQRGVCCAR